MSSTELERRLEEAQATIRALQEELLETNRGLLALTVELDKRVADRTAELSEHRMMCMLTLRSADRRRTDA